jgi:hypothetical protein
MGSKRIREPREQEAFFVEIADIHGKTVYLNVRVRTEKNWLYYDRVPVLRGGSFCVLSDQEEELVPSAIGQFEKIPR